MMTMEMSTNTNISNYTSNARGARDEWHLEPQGFFFFFGMFFFFLSFFYSTNDYLEVLRLYNDKRQSQQQHEQWVNRAAVPRWYVFF
jgi:hypothetical protein